MDYGFNTIQNFCMLHFMEEKRERETQLPFWETVNLSDIKFWLIISLRFSMVRHLIFYNL